MKDIDAGRVAVGIYYDPDAQQVRVQPDPEQAKNWDFVVALLEMAKMAAENMRKMAAMQQMAAAAEQQAQNQRLARRVIQGN